MLEQSPELLFRLIIGATAGLVGVVVGSLVAAVGLRLAAAWLSMPTIPYFAAYKSALTSSLVLLLNFLIGFNSGLATSLMRGAVSSRPVPMSYSSFEYSPFFFFHILAGGLLLTAAIFCRTIPPDDKGQRLIFRDAVALAGVYMAVSALMLIAVLLILWLLAFAISPVFNAG